MALIEQLANFGLWYILVFTAMLSLLVFVHELGHYLVARWNGVHVEVFSIGFGPELFGWTSRSGTRWKFAMIPLGGYVRMFGDTNAASATFGEENTAMSAVDRARSHPHKRVGQRAAIAFGGPLFNILFAILIFAAIYATAGRPATTPQIDEVVAGSPAAAAGLLPGDVITAINDQPIERFEEIMRFVRDRPGERVQIAILRDGVASVLPAAIGVREGVDRFGNAHRAGQLGVMGRHQSAVVQNPVSAVAMAASDSFDLSGRMLTALWGILVGTNSSEELGGVLRIAQISGDIAREAGLVSLMSLVAVLSLNLGLINLLPIPVLDGGHLLLYAFEAVRGKPLGRRIQEAAALTGLAVILGLMIFSTWNDLVHLRVFSFVARLVG